MINLAKKLKSNRGVSLLEVMIALSITGIITLAVFKAYLTQHENYTTQEEVTSIQQNARVVIDELSKHIRMAGNRIPQSVSAIVPSNTNPDSITISYRIDTNQTVTSMDMANASSALVCADDVSFLKDGQWAYIFHPDSGGGEWFKISTVQTSTKTIQHSSPLTHAYAADAMIINLQQLKFFVDNTTDTEHPNLMLEFPGMSPRLFADNISNLQFRYVLKNGNEVDVPVLIEDVREVKIGITGRSENADPDDNSKYRLRTYSTSVNIRNL